MGFRTGAYAKVWEVKVRSDVCTDIRVSVSRKNKKTDQYEQDFSGYVRCIGTAAAQKAAKLQKGDRIKIGDCDVTTKYDAERKTTYTNYAMFSFDIEGNAEAAKPSPAQSVDDGEVDMDDLF